MSVPPVVPDPDERDPDATPPPPPPSDAEAFADLAFDDEVEGAAPEPRAAKPETPARRRFRRRLVLRLVLLLLVSIVVPLALEGVWFYYRTYEEAVLLHLNREELVLHFVLSDLNEWLVQRRARVETTLTSQEVQDAVQTLLRSSPGSRRFVNARKALFHRLALRTRSGPGVPLYTDFVFLNPAQQVVAATDPQWENTDLEALPFGQGLQQRWDEVSAGKPRHWLYDTVTESPTAGTLSIASAYPVRTINGDFLGVLVGVSSDLILQQSLRRLNAWLPDGQGMLVRGNGTVYLWDATMGVLRLTDQGEHAAVDALRRAAPLLQQQPTETTLLGAAQGVRSWLARWGLGPAERLVPYEPMSHSMPFPLWWLDVPGVVGLVAWASPLDLGIAVAAPEALVTANVVGLLELRLWVWVALVALTVGVAVMFGRDLLKRVQDLVRVAEAFARGQWDVRAEVVGNDEMALLAYTFNDLADQLQETYATMERELNLRTQQVQLVVTMATVALEGSADAAQMLHTILQRMSERFPRFAYLSLRLWQSPEQGWQPAARVSRLPQAVNLALRAFEPHLATEVGKALDTRVWTNREGQSLRLPPPLNWMVGVPLVSPRRLMGVLFVGGVDAAQPGEYDLFALRLLARQFSLVLEYAHLNRGQRLESEKRRVLGYLLERLPEIAHGSHVVPTLVEGLRAAEAQGVLLAPAAELTDTWRVVYPASDEKGTETVRNLLSLISDGSAHLVVDEGDALGIAALARLFNWQTLGLYPVRDPEGRVLAVWVRGARPGEGEAPPDRARERLFAELLGWIFVYVDIQQRLSVWQVVQKILEYAPEAPSEGHLYLRAWDLLQKHLPVADFFVASSRGGRTAYTFIYPHGQRYYHTTVTPVEQALIHQVVERGQPLLLSDKHKIIAQAGRVMRVATRVPESWLGVPVRLGKQRLGVLGLVQWEKPRAFTDEHRAYLETLAQGLAGVMYAIQQEARLRQRITREQSLRTFAQTLTGLTDVRNMLEFSATEIQRLFEAQAVEIELFPNPVESPTGEVAVGDDGEERGS